MDLFSCGRSKIILGVVVPQILIRADQSQELVFFSRGRKREKELVRAGVRIAEECQQACVGQMCVAAQVADDVRGEKPSFWVISRHEFDCAEPVRLVLPVWLQNIPAIRSQDRQSPSFPASRVKTRGTRTVQHGRVLSRSDRFLTGHYRTIRLSAFGWYPVGLHATYRLFSRYGLWSDSSCNDDVTISCSCPTPGATGWQS
jgi:hypothetical protein